MTYFKHLFKRARSHPRTVLGLLMATLLLSGLLAIYATDALEANARKSPEALQFEKTPEDWLNHEQNASQFRKALDAGSLWTVGLANALPGLVLAFFRRFATAAILGESASGHQSVCRWKRLRVLQSGARRRVGREVRAGSAGRSA